MSLRHGLLIAAALGAGAWGCSAPAEVDDVADAADAAGALTQGTVVIEREVSGDAVQAAVSAKFMRIAAGVDPVTAEHLVGSRLEAPAVGACMALGVAELPSLPRTSRLAIELLEAGDVSVHVDRIDPGADGVIADDVGLVSRAFPDVGDLVSGVFYTTRDDGADLASGRYLVRASGSPQLDKFEVAATAPSDLDEVHVGGDSLADGLVFEAGQSILLTWQPGEEVSAEDRVLVDITNTAGATTRCAFADVGQASLRGDLFDERAMGLLPALATIEVHRVRRSFFGTTGGGSNVDAGEIRFDSSVLGRVTVDHPDRTSAPTDHAE